MHPLKLLALIASVGMPLWNLPLIIRIIKRKSSSDLSFTWFSGVWVCILLMIPWACMTNDIVLRAFSFVNFTLFSVVGIVMWRYRNGDPESKES